MKWQWHWGTKIALVYLVFATGTLTMVVIAARQPVDLVASDYYEQSLAVDARTAAVENARALGAMLSVSLPPDGNELLITWPAGMTVSSGTITFYRPADGRADKTIAITQDSVFRQRIDVSAFAAGFWRLKLDWIADGRTFFATREVWLK